MQEKIQLQHPQGKKAVSMKINKFLIENISSFLQILSEIQKFKNSKVPSIQKQYVEIPNAPVPFQKPDLIREIEKFKTLTERLKELPYSSLKKN